MKRQIDEHLLRWKSSPARMPLLIRGARQVGKTFSVQRFGKEHYKQLVYINFEHEPDYASCFKTLDPQDILNEIQLRKKVRIDNETLLFIDEIQECPRAIMAMRYFYEMMPQIHIIGAGSLLEFALNDENFRMPVGRIQCLFVYPLSFNEFLKATNNDLLLEHLEQATLEKPPSQNAHETAIKLLRSYFALGGMPNVVAHYIKNKDYALCQDIQQDILRTYRDDFGKYAKHTEHKLLDLVYRKAPGLACQWFKYSKVDPTLRPEKIKLAIEQLTDANLVYPIYSTSAVGLPLATTMNQKKFKLLFLDLGLNQRAMGLEMETILRDDLMLLNQGCIAEQFVGQELVAYDNPRDQKPLYFWVREKTGSSAEVDYVTVINSQIVPIEVKSKAPGHLKSLRLFLEEKNIPLGICISTNELKLEGNILYVPLYMISQLPRLVSAFGAGY